MSDEMLFNYDSMLDFIEDLKIMAEELISQKYAGSHLLDETEANIHTTCNRINSVRNELERQVSLFDSRVSKLVGNSWRGERAQKFQDIDHPEIKQDCLEVMNSIDEAEAELRMNCERFMDSYRYLNAKIDREAQVLKQKADELAVYIEQHKLIDEQA